VYIGAYTSGESASKGVSVGTWDSASHQLQLRAVIPLANPSFLAVDAGHRVLYAVDEQDEGAVSAVAIDPDGGAARVINTESSGGAGPTHLCVHPSGRYVLAANYDSGSIGVLPIRADGGLGLATDLAQHVGSGPNADRQDGPHAHQVLADPSATYLHAVDLGTDSVYAYRLDLGTGKLTERHQVRTRPGSGPRHLAFHPSGQFAYLVTELAGTVISYRYTDGVLTPTHEQPTVPAAARSGSPGAVNQPAEVVVSPDGRFVYVSNRGVDLISVFAVAAGGQLDALGSTPCGGHTPRHITLTPTGAYLFSANQDSNTVTTFAVNRDTGHLAPVGIPLSTPKPVCTLVV
jgi:6-phosphogluconolactonase